MKKGSSLINRLKAYYLVTKPGIVRGNAIHVIAGALFASMLPVDWATLAAVVIGTSLVIASACIANNYMDRGIDSKMKRTSRRPSVTGEISVRAATIYATMLVVAGFGILAAYTNIFVVLIGFAAYFSYVILYGWAKRATVHSTLIGAIPGALPAMAGYVAIDGSLSLGAWLIFLVVFAWQMPHFYAISIFRRKDYAAAGLPVLGAIRPYVTVRGYILGYMLLYVFAVIALIASDVAGVPAGFLLLTAAGYWLIVYATASKADQDKWARSIFGASLLVALALLGASVLNVFIPPYI